MIYGFCESRKRNDPQRQERLLLIKEAAPQKLVIIYILHGLVCHNPRNCGI